jgi:hypothetical protein
MVLLGPRPHLTHAVNVCLKEVSAGPLAELVPGLDRVADRGRDIIAVPDIQGQAWPGQPRAELLPPQEAGQAARTGDQRDGLADDRLLMLFSRLEDST